MRSYAHLSLEEREKLFAWKEKGISIRKIAQNLGREHTTLSRELKRNTKYGKQYIPCFAQKRYQRISVKQRYRAPLKNPEIFLYVREHLRHPYYWSPEIIAGRLKKVSYRRLTITPECIYQYIYSRKAKKYKLWNYLSCGRKRRMKKQGRKIRNNGSIPNAVSISKRPRYIERRKQAGHWETDNMEGTKTSKPALSVTVERSFRYTKLAKVPDQTKLAKTQAVVCCINNFPQDLRRTLTMDNGRENCGHEDISQELKIKAYFCHAYTSWEKGSVERRIKDIRRFIPKGIPLTKVSKDKIEWVEWWVNSRPMKCLSYSTPYEKMQQLISKLEST